MAATKWQKRVASADWDAVGAELDDWLEMCHAAGQPSNSGTASASWEALYATRASDICNE